MPKSPRFPPIPVPEAPPRDIEFVVFPGVQMLDLVGPLQVFASANDELAKRRRPAAYATRVVAQGGGRVPASNGLEFAVQALPARDSAPDTLLIAGGPGAGAAAADATLVEWMGRRARAARRVGAVCTGAFLLAATGALDGCRATTHWAWSADLARRYPRVRVESDPIFVRDGPVWTSAGVTSGIDLALALVEEDLGRDVALAVARYLVVFLKRSGGQAQYSAPLSLQMADDRFGPLHAWIMAHLDRDLTLQVLADQAAMSPRSFIRHYREATGLTPARSVERLRVEEARRLLTDSSMPIKRIAQRCGFGSMETLRRSFYRLLQTTPQDYRDRWR